MFTQNNWIEYTWINRIPPTICLDLLSAYHGLGNVQPLAGNGFLDVRNDVLTARTRFYYRNFARDRNSPDHHTQSVMSH